MSHFNRTQYLIDPKASQFTVQAFASGLISAVAHSPKVAIREWKAKVSVAEEAPFNASLTVSIDTRALEVIDELPQVERREIHRVMFNEVLETRRFPDISFESTRIYLEKLRDNLCRANIEGNLLLHGVTNPQTLISQVAFGVDTFRAHGEFTLLQSDYEIPIASIAGGTLKLRDELKFSFYLVGRKHNAMAATAV